MLAVIADIHGNLEGLEAALEDIKQVGADQLVCLGDVGSGGPQPRETLRRVQELHCPVVLGNTDMYLIGPSAKAAMVNPSERMRYLLAIERWCAEQLTDADHAFVRTFQKTVRLELGGFPILCFHGSPKSYSDLIVATTPDETLAELLTERAPLMLGGHTHVQLLRRYQDVTFVNPGSVGRPYETSPTGADTGGEYKPARAEYALVEVVKGQPNITFRRVPYNLAPLRKAAEASGMPYTEKWLSGWLDQTTF